MNMIVKIWTKIRCRWIKLRLQPIRVFCLHHVCEQFDVESMFPDDWMALSEFKQKIKNLHNQGYQFISLTDAYNHLKNDLFRRKKYAVLTFDDGYESLMEVLPWLEEQHIPTTLFISGKYLDGKSYRDTPKEQYLTHEELFALNSPLIEIGHHGWNHTDATKMTAKELEDSMQNNIKILSFHPRYIPFWAYTWGKHTIKTDIFLLTNHIIPVFINGMVNHNNSNEISRELL